jgi:formylmethanofuran dehydrogenase subunit E
VTDDILKQVIICEISKRPFMRHPDVRHEERMKLRPGRTLYLRNCDQCNTTMLSVYDKEYDWKVYCEHCYQKEVFA